MYGRAEEHNATVLLSEDRIDGSCSIEAHLTVRISFCESERERRGRSPRGRFHVSVRGDSTFLRMCGAERILEVLSCVWRQPIEKPVIMYSA